MKVFISWSGEPSKRIASIIYEWLPQVLQGLQLYMSTETDKGSIWFSAISSELSDSGFGIICLTPNNRDANWVHFEAGALAHNFSKSNVAPLLLGLTPSDVAPPLSLFQLVEFTKADVLKLLKNLNVANMELPEKHIENQFEKWWPELEANVTHEIASAVGNIQSYLRRTERELLEELLLLTRDSVRGQTYRKWDIARAEGTDLFQSLQLDKATMEQLAHPGVLLVLKYINDVPSVTVRRIAKDYKTTEENIEHAIELLLTHGLVERRYIDDIEVDNLAAYNITAEGYSAMVHFIRQGK